MDMKLIVVVIAVVVVAVLLVALFYMRRRRSMNLRERFGPEYERTVRERGASRAETELEQRVKRVERLRLQPLSQSARRGYLDRWMEIQRRFVDDPKGAVFSADELINEVMNAEGYPMSDFDQRAADISVDHPLLVSNYRVAHDITMRERGGAATTEELRKAIVHYRFLFEQLIESEPEGREGREVA
jgi:FtsZ-interacting cell division protein ZipA